MKTSKENHLIIPLILLLFLFPACQNENGGPTSLPDRTNVIFIMADDLGYGDLGCYGQKVIQTPFIDQLAAEGTRFTACYAGAPVCAPSRSVLMTGQHTGHTTVRGNFGKGGVIGLGGGKGRVPLRDSDRTLAEILKEEDYVTGMTGKWGLGEPGTSGEPLKQGFEEWFGYLNQRRAHTYYPAFLWHNEARFPLEGNQDGKHGTYSHDLFTDFALNFIKEYKNQPFFLYIPYTIPHAKYEIPDLGPYADRPWSEEEKIHAAMVTRMDRDIGKLMRLIKELGIDEQTIVFFCSDNGAARRWEGRFDSSGPLRGHKRDLYEGGIRVPMIVRWPERVPAGKTDDTPWYFADVLPTVAELADAETPEGVDGISILPTLLGKTQDLRNRYLYWEFYERGFQQAVRWRQWKGIRLHPDSSWQLYHLEWDLAETKDLALSHSPVVELMDSLALSSHDESPEWPTNLERYKAGKVSQ